MYLGSYDESATVPIPITLHDVDTGGQEDPTGNVEWDIVNSASSVMASGISGFNELNLSSNVNGCYQMNYALTAAYFAGNTYIVYVNVTVDGVTANTAHSFQVRAAVNSNLMEINGDSVAGNAATLTLKQLDIQNSAGTAFVAKSTGSNGHGMDVAGNGSGEGVVLTAGATGYGLHILGGGTSGDAVHIEAQNGNAYGIYCIGNGGGEGVVVVGGDTANGLECRGGASGGAGIYAFAQTSNHGIMVLGKGAGHGIHATGGDGGGAGINAVGSTSNASGIVATGDGSGSGIDAVGGDSGGDGISARATTASGHGIHATGHTAGVGILAAGGTGGSGLSVTGQGALPGMLITGGDTDADALSLVPGGTGDYITDGFIKSTSFAAGAINAAAIADAAIDNATFAADVGSTAYATNIVALAVRKALDEIKLDHLVAIADADDVVNDSIMAKLASTTGDWSTFVDTTDSLQSNRDNQGTAQTGDAYAIVNNGTYGNAYLVRSTTPANTLTVAADGSVTADTSGTQTACEDAIDAKFTFDSNGYIDVNVMTVLDVTPISNADIQSECEDAIDAKINTTAGVVETDVVSISGDTTAADNMELAFDTTGYAFTGCSMPSVTGAVGSVTGAVGSVTGAVGSVTGLTIANGAAEANITYIHGTALTETPGQLAASFKKFFDVSAPTGTVNSIPDAVAGATGGIFIAGTNAATSITTALTANITGTITGNIEGDLNGSAASVTNAVGSVAGNVDGDVSGSVGSVTGAVGSVTGAVGSVTGAVGSVAGNVDGNVTGSVGSVADMSGVQEECEDAIDAKFVFDSNNYVYIANAESSTLTAQQIWEYATRVLTDKSDFNLAADQGTVTIGVCSVNTDMVGTDNAALAATALSTAQWTNARAGYLDELAAANLPTDVSNIPTNPMLNTEDGSSFIAIPWNSSWNTEVQSECDDAIQAAFVFDSSNYVYAANTGSTITPQQIWEYTTRILTAATNITSDDSQINITTGRVDANLKSINSDLQSCIDFKDFADNGYDPITNKVQGVIKTDTASTVTDGAKSATALSTATWTAARAGYLDNLLATNGVTLASAQGLYAPAKAGDLMGLADTAITAAKFDTDAIAAAVISADAVTKIQAGLATTVALATVQTGITAIQATTTKLDTTVELDGVVYKFTETALEETPSGSGGDASKENQETMITSLAALIITTDTIDANTDSASSDMDFGE